MKILKLRKLIRHFLHGWPVYSHAIQTSFCKLSYSFNLIHFTFISCLEIQNSEKIISFQCWDKVLNEVPFLSRTGNWSLAFLPWEAPQELWSQLALLAKSTMLGINSVPLAAPIGTPYLLHGCLLINRQCIQVLDAEHKREIREKKRRVREKVIPQSCEVFVR